MWGEIISIQVYRKGVAHDLPVGVDQYKRLSLLPWEQWLGDKGYVSKDHPFFVTPFKCGAAGPNPTDVQIWMMAEYNQFQNYLRARFVTAILQLVCMMKGCGSVHDINNLQG